jgi:hypothetical protein
MKLFSLILSFIVLVLTVNPCIDKPKEDSLLKTEIIHHTDDGNNHNDTDHCSPFCICQCCQSFFFVSDIALSFPAAELKISYSEYSPYFQSIELFDFLIPPKS